MGTGVEVPVDGVDVAACGGAPYRVFACAVRRGAEAVGYGQGTYAGDCGNDGDHSEQQWQQDAAQAVAQ